MNYVTFHKSYVIQMNLFTLTFLSVQACCFMYLLMRCNFEFSGTSCVRVHHQVIKLISITYALIKNLFCEIMSSFYNNSFEGLSCEILSSLYNYSFNPNPGRAILPMPPSLLDFSFCILGVRLYTLVHCENLFGNILPPKLFFCIRHFYV